MELSAYSYWTAPLSPIRTRLAYLDVSAKVEFGTTGNRTQRDINECSQQPQRGYLRIAEDWKAV